MCACVRVFEFEFIYLALTHTYSDNRCVSENNEYAIPRKRNQQRKGCFFSFICVTFLFGFLLLNAQKDGNEFYCIH